jgi:small ligand-binding sensory domain FIST
LPAEEDDVKIRAALSTKVEPRAAGMEAAMDALNQLSGDRADLALLFASPHFTDRSESLLEAVSEAVRPAALIGCVAEGVVGQDKEIENEPAAAVWLASIGPDTEVSAFEMTFEESHFKGWPAENDSGFLMLCDPYSLPTHLLLEFVNENAPDCLWWAAWQAAHPAPAEPGCSYTIGCSTRERSVWLSQETFSCTPSSHRDAARLGRY